MIAQRKKNLQFWEERKRNNIINKYLSPGVYSKRYSRRIKIGKIFGINVPNIIITSTPKGPNNFPQIW
jgi:hypothetical protein